MMSLKDTNPIFKKLCFAALICVFYFTTGFTVVGHRGDPINAPEETFQSFDVAFDEGADYVELDLHRSQDGVLVVSHDRNLQRVTGQNVIVSQTPFAQLQKLHMANGEPVRSLDEVFAHYQNNPNAKFLLETKKTKAGNPKDMEALMVKAIQKYHMADRVMVHSFSLKSLQQMQTLMPAIPRIYIVGSLKKINFEALQTINAINISSDLVTAELVDQLHYLNKKVYIWDEMTEKQKSWNYIVNLPIDGVVTNYPAIGASYKALKNDARTASVNQSGTLVSDQKAITYVNPYRSDLVKSDLKPFTPVQISQKISIGDQTYYQIGSNRFVLADAINLETDLSSVMTFLNQSIHLKPGSVAQTAYASPLYPQQTTGTVMPNKAYRILAVRSVSGAIWFRVSSGWIQSSQCLIRMKSMANDSHALLNAYLQADPATRLNNIDITASLPSMLTYLNKKPQQSRTANTSQNVALKAITFYPMISHYANNNKG